MKDDKDTKAGFVAILGAPNAGKSTLINTIVGSKVSIVSRKVQTTRSRVLGIVSHDNAQIVLVDTPGIFKPKKTLERAMVRAAFDAQEDADVIVHIVDVSARDMLQKNAMLIEKFTKNKSVILVLNKVDICEKIKLLEQTKALNDLYPYVATFMISGLKNQGVEALLSDLAARLPVSPWFYDEDQITDMPMRLMASEITREKIYDQLHQELPYAIMVQTESWDDFDNGDLKLRQVIFVQQDSQKSIVLGKAGSKIKKIGMDARKDLEEMFDRRVHLSLHVKVQSKWDERPETYLSLGLETQR